MNDAYTTAMSQIHEVKVMGAVRFVLVVLVIVILATLKWLDQ